MERTIRWYDYFTVNAYWLGLTSLSQTMTPLVVPLLVQQFVGEAAQGSAYGNLRMWTLMVAVLVQSIMGTLSDRSMLPLGRRRPFILIGTIGLVVVVLLVGLSAKFEGNLGYQILFGLIILQMVFANTANAATQGLIPDIVPEEKRGRFSGVKAILEVPVPVILVSLTIAKLISSGNLWGGLIVVCIILVAMAAAAMFAPEKQRLISPGPLDWKPFLRLGLMTAAFTVVILFSGFLIRAIGSLTGSLSDTAMVITMAAAGLAAMLLAVALGVWASLKIGLGEEGKHNTGFVWWVISRLAFLVGSTNLAGFVLYFLQGRFGYDREKAAGPAAMLTMFVGVFILLAAVPSGWLSDRYDRRILLSASGLVAALGTLVIVLSQSIAWLYVGAVLFGVAVGFFYSVNWAMGTDVVPKEHAGRFLGMANLAGAGAGAVGAYIGGPIADLIAKRFGLPGGTGYTVLFCIYGILFLISVAALYKIPAPENLPA